MGDWKRAIYITSILSCWLGLIGMYLVFRAFTSYAPFIVVVFLAMFTMLLFDPFITFIADYAINFIEALFSIGIGGILAYITIKLLLNPVLAKTIPWL